MSCVCQGMGWTSFRKCLLCPVLSVLRVDVTHEEREYLVGQSSSECMVKIHHVFYHFISMVWRPDQFSSITSASKLRWLCLWRLTFTLSFSLEAGMMCMRSRRTLCPGVQAGYGRHGRQPHRLRRGRPGGLRNAAGPGPRAPPCALNP